MTLYFLKYNNYYNRIVKFEPNLTAYQSYVLKTLEVINFKPNDGVKAQQDLPFTPGESFPDYVIVANDTNDIVSRWFVIEAVRVRGEYYSLQLHRDLVVDFYDNVISAPCFIEKATLPPGDAGIFNSENMGFNQIKTSEKLLKDQTTCPWIVGYLDPDFDEAFELTIPAETPPSDIPEYSTFGDFPYYNKMLIPSDGVVKRAWRINYYTDLRAKQGTIGYDDEGNTVPLENAGNAYENNVYIKDVSWETATGIYVNANDDLTFRYHLSNAAIDTSNRIKNSITVNLSNLESMTYAGNAFYNFDLSTLKGLNESLVKIAGNYYMLGIRYGYQTSFLADIEGGSDAYNKLIQCVEVDDPSKLYQYVFQLEVTGQTVGFDLIPYDINQLTLSFPGKLGRTHCSDAPYDMFAMPLGEVYVDNIAPNYKTDANVALNFAAQIQKKFGANTSELYDIQLLPYCPIPDGFINSNYKFDEPMLSALSVNVRVDKMQPTDTTPITDSIGNVRSFLYWAKSSRFTKVLPYKIEIGNTAEEIKISNECDLYRLASPNYSSAFEFSAAKNNGVYGFRVDCQYKPVNPYIRVAPTFSGLYGPIGDDARGLICCGEFSLSKVDDAFLAYERQNKNYQNTFDRQIESMEFKNNIARVQERWQVAAGVGQAAVSGGIAGGMIGGGIGAGIGAVAGAGLSAVGGIADIYYNEQLRNEAIDYTKDLFGFQLGNIKALPTTLVNVSAFNPNNKIFPLVEYYTCTDVEKEALRNKLKYNGMTVMRIGKIQDFIQSSDKTYIKGQLIRLEDIHEEFHLANSLANEIYKGVFI